MLRRAIKAESTTLTMSPNRRLLICGTGTSSEPKIWISRWAGPDHSRRFPLLAHLASVQRKRRRHQSQTSALARSSDRHADDRRVAHVITSSRRCRLVHPRPAAEGKFRMHLLYYSFYAVSRTSLTFLGCRLRFVRPLRSKLTKMPVLSARCSQLKALRLSDCADPPEC